jgi:hypothetical protein
MVNEADCTLLALLPERMNMFRRYPVVSLVPRFTTG